LLLHREPVSPAGRGGRTPCVRPRIGTIGGVGQIVTDHPVFNIDDADWIRQISSDPVAALEQSRVPTLLLYGQRDPWVPVGVSLATLRPFSTRHPNVTTVVIDGADHMMMLGVDPAVQMDPKAAPSEAPNAPAYFSAIATWLAQRALTQVTPHKAHTH
jgi:pimeloyl-ACP methyl ester carboxylesterase